MNPEELKRKWVYIQGDPWPDHYGQVISNEFNYLEICCNHPSCKSDYDFIRKARHWVEIKDIVILPQTVSSGG